MGCIRIWSRKVTLFPQFVNGQMLGLNCVDAFTDFNLCGDGNYMALIKNFGLGAKIAVGFTVVLVLTVIVGGAGLVALGKVADKIGLYQSMSQVKSTFAGAREQVDRFGLNNYHEGRERQAQARQAALDGLRKCKALLTACEQQGSVSAEIIDHLKDALSQLSRYADLFSKVNG